MSIDIEADGLISRCRATEKLMSQAETEAYKLADYFKIVIAARTPVKTGKTKASWTIHYHRGGGDQVVWWISPDGREQEASFIEFGTKPHVIMPRGEALKFETRGEIVYANIVFHPGSKPLGICRITQDELDKETRAIAVRLLNSIGRLWA